MSTEHSDTIVTIGPASGEIRRRIEPASWLVLEELLLAAAPTEDGWQATISVRTLAERTGMSKDTVARAIGRLRSAGLVAPRPSRNAGHFAAGVYELTLPNGVNVTTDDAPRTKPTPTSNGRSSAVDVDQLSLLAIES